MKNFIKTTIAATMVFALSACSTDAINESEKFTKDTMRQSGSLVKSAGQPLPSADTGKVQVFDEVWLGGKAFLRQNGSALPNSVEREGVSLFSSNEMSLQEVAQLITETTGINIVFTRDARDHLIEEQPADNFFKVNHKGALSKYLNKVTGPVGLSWKYDGKEIEIYRYATKTFAVNMLPSRSTGSISVNSSGGESGSGTSDQRSSSDYEIDIWAELVETLEEIVDETGSVSASQSTGTISITTTNSVFRKVEDYLEEQNKRLSRQVAISVQVFNVSIEDRDEYGSDLTALIRSAAGDSADFNVVNSTTTPGASLGWTLLNPTRGVTSLTGIVKMLSSQGDVSVVTTANATTLNNVPTPIQVGNSRGYVSAITETVTGTDMTSTTVETDEVSTGFNMQLLPRIIQGGKVALQYNISTSELIGPNDGFDQVNIAGNQIQLPNRNIRSFTQQVMIPNGNTLVLSGYEQTTARTDKKGVGSADNWLAGGSRTGSLQRDVMVIMITPVILDVGAAIVQTR